MRLGAIHSVVCVAVVSAAVPAVSQTGGPLSAKQCSDAISIANAIVQRNKGKISVELRDSFVRFGESKCDLNTDWKLMNKADEQVFGEFGFA